MARSSDMPAFTLVRPTSLFKSFISLSTFSLVPPGTSFCSMTCSAFFLLLYDPGFEACQVFLFFNFCDVGFVGFAMGLGPVFRLPVL